MLRIADRRDHRRLRLHETLPVMLQGSLHRGLDTPLVRMLIPCCSRCMRATRRQWVARRCYGDQFHTTGLDPFDARKGRIHSADADIGNAGMNELGHSSERLNVQSQSHCRERRLECPHCIDQPRRRQHHIISESYLGLQSIEQSFDLSPQVVDADRDRASDEVAWVLAGEFTFKIR
jgi:hypothetical protein